MVFSSAATSARSSLEIYPLRSNQSILREINPEYWLEGLMLKLKLQYSGHLMRRTDSFEKTLMLGKIEGGRRRGWQRMRWLDGITDSTDVSLSKLWGDGGGQAGLACCSPWGCKESDTTEHQRQTLRPHPRPSRSESRVEVPPLVFRQVLQVTLIHFPLWKLLYSKTPNDLISVTDELSAYYRDEIYITVSIMHDESRSQKYRSH